MRALVGWSQTKLAERAEMLFPTVTLVEAGNGTRVSEEARLRLQRAFESGGVEFIDENGGGPGARLRKGQRPKQPK